MSKVVDILQEVPVGLIIFLYRPHHIKGRIGKKSTSFERRTAIAPEHELIIVECIKSMERAGFGLSRKEVLIQLKEFVTENNISNPFKDNMPSKDWFISFRKSLGLSLKNLRVLRLLGRKQPILSLGTNTLTL